MPVDSLLKKPHCTNGIGVQFEAGSRSHSRHTLSNLGQACGTQGLVCLAP